MQMPCYGREILECVARKYDISVEQIEQYEEGVTNSFLYTVFVMSKAQSGDMNMLSDEGKVYPGRAGCYSKSGTEWFCSIYGTLCQ